MINRRSTVGIVVFLVAMCSTLGFYLFAGDLYSEHQVRKLIEDAYNTERPGGGRLSGSPYSPIKAATSPRPGLGRAQFVLLHYPQSDTRQKLQGLIYLAAGEWRAFVDSFDHVPSANRQDPATLNNLGTSLLALSNEDVTSLLKALDRFEQASVLDPRAPEPLFNLVITFRKLRLPGPAADALRRYEELDPDSAWHRELTDAAGGEVNESAAVDALRQSAKNNDFPEFERLFDQNPELCRRMAMGYALADIDEPEGLVRSIATQIERRFGDKTISAMLAPLLTNRREATIAVRKLVNKGGELYLRGDLKGSLAAYDEAYGLTGKTDPVFQRLWIDINRVDTQIRAGEFDSARESLQTVISSAREHGFRWLQAKALSIYGSSLRLTNSYAEMITLLTEADRMFVDMGASYDRVRPLYYLAVYQYGAGDQTEALRLALECLRLTDESDNIRMSSLKNLIGSILYRQGMPARAVLFEKESVKQSQKASNAGLEATAAATLAQLYESMSRRNQAEESMKVAENAFDKVPAGFEQTKADLFLSVVRARIYVDQKRYEEAETLIKKNLAVYGSSPFQVTNLVSQSLMLLARVYAETGRTSEAARGFNKAIEVVENDDHYLETEKLRVKFDDERRELYDSAIDFEYNHGSPDAAWAYVQRYRAKLFLEFLAQFNPDIDRIRGEALDRSRVQKLVPADTQVLEYVLLKDRLLIWLISDKFFTVRSIAVSRSELEDKIQEVLQKLRSGDDVDPLLRELGRLLIQPIDDLLDPNRTIAIIPDRALHGLPFAAIRRPGNDEYLIQNFPILVSPSLTHLLTADAARPERNSIVGFGSQSDDSSEAKELAALQTIYPKSATFAGAGINKSQFLTAMTSAPVIHYAGHSATDAVDPLRSSILLDGNRYGPNSVTAVDIATEHLWKNAVVVLSSCDSSVGNSRDGIGIRGLTSAFLIGGAGSVVGSLWPVEASSTSELMISFHRAFATDQMPVAKALRSAQLAFLQSNPARAHPYYWSGFVVTGTFSALR